MAHKPSINSLEYFANQIYSATSANTPQHARPEAPDVEQELSTLTSDIEALEKRIASVQTSALEINNYLFGFVDTKGREQSNSPLIPSLSERISDLYATVVSIDHTLETVLSKIGGR